MARSDLTALRARVQNVSRKARRTTRPPCPAEVMVPKLEPVETLAAGLSKCGVLVALNASPRNCRSNRSVRRMLRKRLRSRLNVPGGELQNRPEFREFLRF